MSTHVGAQAENLVASHLRRVGHKVLEQNWRNRRCEIDIVSKLKDVVYCTEVKYRSSTQWGDGFDYITPKKLSQMEFAAEQWAAQADWHGDLRLQAAAVDADDSVSIIEL